MICLKKKNKNEIKKFKNIIHFLIFISNTHPLYNYILHLMNYILNNYRKYNINAKICNPNNNLANQFEIRTFPSTIILKKEDYYLYNGTDINQIEKCIREFIT